MPNTPKHPPMTFREAVEITRDRRACYGLDRARAIVDQAVRFVKAYTGHNESYGYGAPNRISEEWTKLRALERGEGEVQP